ncbi:MAG: DEAD/DEAH box helicase [Candidatus Paceibacteria bacterium]
MKSKSEYQDIWSDFFIEKGNSGLLHLAPRSGKTRTALKIATKTNCKKVLVVYPDNKIKNSWIKDINDLAFKAETVYTTYLSLHKHIDKYDYVFLDEIHQTSEAQRQEIVKLLKINDKWAGLSGSLSNKTLKELNQYFKAKVIINYTIEQAIKDGLISNYEIHVVSCKLDDKITFKNKKGKLITEKKAIDNYEYVINMLRNQRKSTMFAALGRMRLIQKSIGKINKTKELLEQFKDERVLIFNGLTTTANSFGSLVHHSKNENEEEFVRFTNDKSKFKHLSVVKIGNSGVTFQNLDKIILNYFDSNEENTTQKICRALLLNEDQEKTAQIYIVCTNEEFEKKWLQKSLKMFTQSKIYYE